jgi:hypothetical protein
MNHLNAEKNRDNNKDSQKGVSNTKKVLKGLQRNVNINVLFGLFAYFKIFNLNMCLFPFIPAWVFMD